MTKVKFILLFLSIFNSIVWISCETRSEKLTYALKLSGDNRNELEKVLKHYSENPADSLKLKAAIFLIENMPGHFTYNGPYLKDFKRIVDTLPDSYWIKKVMLMQPYRHKQYREQLIQEEDVKYIKADYLIHNIDIAFNALETKSWLQALPFEDFCEYLLPYRIDNELLDSWKDTIIPSFANKIEEKARYCDDQKYSPYNLGRDASMEFYAGEFSPTDVIAGVSYQKGECVNDSRLRLLGSRNVGIASTIDFVPAWADMNGYHYWLVIIDPKYKAVTYHQIEGKTAPKVYRKTFSGNEIPLDPKGENFIPEFFKDPFMKDVTDQYLNTSDIKIDLIFPPSRGVKYAYLAMFNDQTLKMIDWGKIKHNQVEFSKLGRGIVYFPFYFSGNQLKNGNYPFILKEDGNIEFLKPDTTQRQKMKLVRKNPVSSYKAAFGDMLLGSNFIVSNDISFKDSVLVHTITKNPYLNYATFSVDTLLQYRYWKIDNAQFLYLAELIFRDKNGNKLPWEIIPQKNNLHEQHIKDNDPLTYAQIANKIIIDFSQPTRISSVSYLPFNDANIIRPGNEYELFYYGLRGWQSMGKKIAQDTFIEYESVPSGALYWLRNLTEGREERPFTLKNGIIRFW